jgi:hypothetical protein
VLRDHLLTQLGRFDEAAYCALANKGLLRRAQKDLEKQTPEIIDETSETLVVSLGEHRIQFDVRGPAHAKCSCPATSVCQHILAAAIGLQRAGIVAPAGTTAEARAEQPNPLATLQAELLAYSAEQLTKYAGKAGYRWAWQFVADLDTTSDLKISGDRNLVLGLVRPRMQFRYMGGGLDGLIADVAMTHIEKYRVAVVLAFQRTHGIEGSAPEAVAAPRTRALDLGKDHAEAQTPAEHLEDSRKALRASAAQLFSETISLGLSHLSIGMQERFSTLAVWAQGVEYYRLALLLRRLADHVELLLERAGAADEHILLDELTMAYALIAALEDAARRGSNPSHLVGKARSRYQDSSALELVGLGAMPWRSASGYIGLTMLFWSPKDQAYFTCSDARPETQRGFNPIARYTASGPWSGLGAPSQATGRQLVLTGAQLNASGRISAAEGTSVAIAPRDKQEDLAARLHVSTDWDSVLQERNARRRSLLAERQPASDWVALKPASFGSPRFDAARQTLSWPLIDEYGRQMDAELSFSDFTSHAISRIEQLAATDIKPGTILIAHIRDGQRGAVAEPLSLVWVRPSSDENPIDCLHFDPAPERGFLSKWLGAHKPQSGDRLPSQPTAAPPVLPPILGELRHFLQRQAERGISEESISRFQREIGALAERASRAGLDALQRSCSAAAEAAEQLMRANYLCLQYERLLGHFIETDESNA